MAVRILIADDESITLEILEHALRQHGYDVVSAADGESARQRLQDDPQIRLAVLDWEMPGMDGLELCRWIRKHRDGAYTYVIMQTGRVGKEDVVAGLAAGADDFLSKPVNPEEMRLRLRGAERILGVQTRDAIIFALAKLAESRDPETGAHLERTRTYCRLLADELLYTHDWLRASEPDFARLIWLTSPLHDIGKVGIPDAVLNKAGALTDEEFEVIKTHPIIGAETLDVALRHSPGERFLEFAREMVISHHEKWDGSGYPHGLAGAAIPMPGRVMAVADVYDALTSRRCYKAAMPHSTAAAIIRESRGRHFDPDVVDAFDAVAGSFDTVRQRLQDDPDEIRSPPDGFSGTLAA